MNPFLPPYKKVCFLIGLCCVLICNVKAQEPSTSLPTFSTAEQRTLQDMIDKRSVRVLVPFGRTLYFIDDGQEKGVTAEIFRLFETYINQRFQKQLDNRPITVFLIPTSRDRLLKKVNAGFGDIAAGNLTVTQDRKEICDFYVAPHQDGIAEVLVTHKDGPRYETPYNLSGRDVYVREKTSYFESLQTLNSFLEKRNQKPVIIHTLPDALEAEDMLELVDTGVIPNTIMDDWMANLWSSMLPNIYVHQDVAIRRGTKTGWAIRHGSTALKDLLDDFYRQVVLMRGHRHDRSWNYERKIKRLHNPVEDQSLKRFRNTFQYFEKYGNQYNFDPLLLAAQGFQESKLNPNAQSHRGAVGIMQLMPSTGASLKVGDITQTENNIHAGAKYMDKLMTHYFQDTDFSRFDRTLFALASYNAGPGNIQKMRTKAAAQDINPDIWFNNVENITAQHMGRETVTYVRNVYKYYVSYRLMFEQHKKRKKAKQQTRDFIKDGES